jgi:hypothetical protein
MVTVGTSSDEIFEVLRKNRSTCGVKLSQWGTRSLASASRKGYRISQSVKMEYLTGVRMDHSLTTEIIVRGTKTRWRCPHVEKYVPGRPPTSDHLRKVNRSFVDGTI